MVTSEGKRPHLAFSLAGEDYLVAIERVRELVAAAPLTPLPGAPRWVRGVFNLRGSVVPLVDLGVKLGVGTSEATLHTSWMVVELHSERRRQLLAVETDEVLEIVEIEDADLFETPPAGMRIESGCVRGVVAYREGFGRVLDLERVLTPANRSPETAGTSND
jgi:purine-binding chemotaxis protein CheW